MRIFWISLIFFALVLGCTAANAIFLRNVTDEMLALLDEMESGDDVSGSLSRLDSLWRGASQRIGWTVGRRRISAVDELLAQLKWAFSLHKQDEFARHLALLRIAVLDLLR